MRFRFTLATFAIATASTLVHCASESEAPSAADDAGGDVVPTPLDAGADSDADGDATADVADAAALDDFEIPDGSVDCNDPRCATAVVGSMGIKSTAAFCALLRDKTVQCWGTNQLDRLGYTVDGGGPLPRSPSPHRVPNLSNVTSLSIAGDNTCATDESGKVVCWGALDLVKSGLEGDGGTSTAKSALPTELALVPPASAVAVGGKGTACVMTKAGKITCWGKSSDEELARKTTTTPSPPTEIPIDRTDLTAWPGHGSMFATTKTGELFSWGASDCASPYNCKYMLGRDSSEAHDAVPTLVAGGSKVRGLASSAKHVCAVVGRIVECWGGNDLGQLGRGYVGTISELPGPTILAFAAAVDDADAGVPDRVDVPLQVVADTSRTCVVMGSGRIFCWGAIGSDRTKWGQPARVDGLSGPAVGLALAVTTSCALLRTGAVECWGGNIFGALGRGIDDITFTDPQPAPVVFPEE
ncbi:regulator of chromosome condensation, RCC1 [Labilithrix luteola]|uniref:Regulator of chromosome condensation, RCC1 n=1 Tax=Labilithrix luteola TaxID=1391654 RepID=A0A0K1PJD6_9BACT|nr:hypothetical protein [Labilithrix luteola]AKU93658.1 regulator of chromosome condensation, RCC1 [Labilithrix luteola]